MITQEIKKTANEIFEKIVAIRRTIHMHPELGYEEYETGRLVKQFLDELGIEHYDTAKTGIVALIRGAKEGKTLGIRADMDALPIQEENDCEYKSKIDGVMHACGHDAHTASLLGAAYIINKYRHRLKGNVKLFFQPGEEGIGGAKPMIDEGCLENPYVDAVIAGHVMSYVPCGKIYFKHGAIMASPDDFHITIKGHGGHGGYPHRTIDPVVIACYVVTALQTIVSRYSNPVEPCVLTIGHIEAGTATNVIPDTAIIEGTARSLSPEMRAAMPKMIEDIVKGVTEGMGAQYEFEFVYLYPPTMNDPALTDKLAQSTEKIIGKENIIWGNEPSMGGEDFAYFGEARPACFLHIGCGNPDKGCAHAIHSSHFNIDEDCMRIAASTYAQFAFDFLGEV